MIAYSSRSFTSTGKTMKVTNLRDGIDHLSIGTFAVTVAGKALSPYNLEPFTHPELGHFKSLHGYYQYLQSGLKVERLRGVYGAVKGTFKRAVDSKTTIAKHLEEGIRAQYEQNPHLIEALLNTGNLPIVNYHYFGNNVVDNKAHRQILICLGKIRQDYYDLK